MADAPDGGSGSTRDRFRARHVVLTEAGRAQAIALTDGEAAILEASGLVSLTRTASTGEWTAMPGRKAGTLQVGTDLQVSVLPKFPIDRLVFMMGYARNPDFWKPHTVELSTHDELPEALAHTFIRSASKALQRGLLQGYRNVDDSLNVVRGRIRTDDQLRLRYSMPLPVEVRYQDFTVDIAENQILLAATLVLLRAPRLSSPTRAALHRIRATLTPVSAPTPGDPLPPWQPSRLNERYHTALHVAELIVAAGSFEQRGSTPPVPVSGFIFDTWKIFEDFVCVALRESMVGRSGRAKLQHHSYLDHGRRIELRPDFMWWDGERPTAVIDAKYKAAEPGALPNTDAYQILAYCTVFGLQDGHLVYADGNNATGPFHVAGSPITLHRHALSLDADPTELLDQVRAVADEIHNLIDERKTGATRVPA